MARNIITCYRPRAHLPLGAPVRGAVLLGAVLLGAGCAGPREDPERFIGTWNRKIEGEVVPPGTLGSLTLELRPDGSALRCMDQDPHADDLVWYLRGDKLVLAARGGGPAQTLDFQFNAPDELVVTSEDGEVILGRTD